jgi:hypothetical protein
MSRVRALPAIKRILAITALCALGACGDQGATKPTESAARGDLLDGPSPGATLVECPTSETKTASATINASGGTVSIGGTSVLLPKLAVLTPTLVELTIPASRYMEIGVTANGGHFLFRQPVVITIDYSRCGRSDVLSKPLSVWYINSQTKALIENMGGVDDKLLQSITFTTDHLSGYAIAF